MTALYLLGALLLVLLVGVVLAPLLEREPPDEPIEELPPEERREAAVEALGEIEFEYRTDKLPEEEYRRLRTYYGRLALAAEDEIEVDGARAGPPACPECESRVPRGARFCPACGSELRHAGEEA